MEKNMSMSNLLAVLCVLVLFSGCASYYQYNNVSKHYGFSVGDHVKLRTEQTGEVSFKVTEVTASAVHGEGIEIPIEDIQEAYIKNLDQRQLEQDLGKGAAYTFTALLAVAGIAVAFLAP